MTPADIAMMIRAVDALLSLLGTAGIAAAKINSMREGSASGHLTDEDVHTLALSARDSIDKLGPRDNR